MWRPAYRDIDQAREFLEERIPTYRDALDIVQFHGYDSYLVELVISKYHCSPRKALSLARMAHYHHMVVAAIISKPGICSLGKSFELADLAGNETQVLEAIIQRADWKSASVEMCLKLFKDFVWGCPDGLMAQSIFQRSDCPEEESLKYMEEYYEDLNEWFELDQNMRVPWEDVVRAHQGEDD